MGLPDTPARAIDWALDFNNPSKRPQTVKDWRAAFKPPVSGEPLPGPHTPQPGQNPGPTPPPKLRERPSSPLAVVGVTLGAVGVIGALIVTASLYLMQQTPQEQAVAIELQLGREWISLPEAVASGSAKALAPMTATALAEFDPAILDETGRSFALVADKAIRIRYRDPSNAYRVVRAGTPGAFPTLPKGVSPSRLEIRAEDQAARLWILDERGASALP